MLVAGGCVVAVGDVVLAVPGPDVVGLPRGSELVVGGAGELLELDVTGTKTDWGYTKKGIGPGSGNSAGHSSSPLLIRRAVSLVRESKPSRRRGAL